MKNKIHQIPAVKLFLALRAGLAAICILLGGNALTQAQVVNFDAPGGEGSVNGQTPANYSGQGAYTDLSINNYWNPIVPNGTTTNGVFLSDGTTASTVTLTESQSGFYGAGGAGTAGTPQALEYLFAYANNGGTRTCTLSNVPAGAYALYLYGKNDNNGDANRGTVFTVSNAFTLPTSQGTINSKTANTSFVIGNDYVLFNSITVGGDGIITFTYTHNTNATGTANNQEGDFNGLQLVKVQANPPPTVLTQPKPAVLNPGGTAHFLASILGNGGTLSYHWQTNGVNLTDGAGPSGSIISGSLTTNLTVSNVAVANAANYGLVVTSTTGNPPSTNSAAVPLTIVLPSGNYETTLTAQHPLYLYQFNELGDPATNNTVAFDFGSGDNGIYGVSTQNGNPNYNIAGPTPAQGWPGFASTNTAVAFANGTANERVAVTSPWNLNTNTVTITAWINPNNGTPNAGQRFVFSRGGDTISGFGYCSTNDAFGNPTLGYTWNNDAATTTWNSGLETPLNQWSFVALTVTSSNAVITIMNANGLLTATNVHAHAVQSFNGTGMIGDDPNDTTGARSFAGTIDSVAIFNQAVSYNQLLNVFTNASGLVNYAPLIGVQPTPQSGYPTDTIKFTVNAGGSGVLTYHWQADNAGNSVYANLNDGATGTGSTISGATTATLTISNISAADANNYQVIVSSSFGSPVTSSPASLTLLPTGSPQNVTLSVRQPAGQDWNTTNWSTGLGAVESLAAFPGSTFEVLTAQQVRSVNSGLNVSFPAAPLTLDGTNQFGTPAELLLNHLAPATTFTFQNLVLSGGQIDNGDDGLVTIAGAINVQSNSTIVSDPVFTVINFDTPGSFSANYVGQGAFSDAGRNFWNPLVNNGTTPAGFLDDGVTTSPITLTSHETFTYSDDVGTQGQPSGLEGRFEGATSSRIETNTLNNVPPGNYILYLYGCNSGPTDHDRGTSFTVFTDLTPARTSSTFCLTAGYNQFIEGNDYVVFRNLTVGPAGKITFIYTANPLASNGHNGSGPLPPPNTEADFNGLQLIAVAPSAAARSIQVNATLSGTNSLQYTSSDTNYHSDLIIAGAANTFTGTWNVNQGTLLGGSANSLGTNSITVGTNGALETLYNLNNPGGILFLNGKLFLHSDDTFKAVFLNGLAMAPGTYSAAQLAAIDASAFPTTWPQQVGSTVSTSSGSVHVLTAPPPVFLQDITPQAISVYPSQTAQFSVAVVGTPPFSYSWRLNDTALSDGTKPGFGSVSGSGTNTLSLSNFTAGAGNYNINVVVTNVGGSSTSQVAVLTILPTSPPTTATLTGVEPAGDDWDSAVDWDVNISATQLALQFPGSTNIVPPGTVLNTPNIGSVNAFPGAKLIIQGDGNFVNNPGGPNGGDGLIIGGGSTTSELRASEVGNVTINFPDLQMAGGQFDNSGNNAGNGNATQSLGMLTVTGKIEILGNTTIYSDSGVRANSLRAIKIGALLTGNGTITYSAFDTSLTNDLDIAGSSNTFTGPWIVVQGPLLGSAPNSLGTNAINIGAAGALETAYNLNNPAADLTLDGRLLLHQADTFKTVTVGGLQLPAGTYSAVQLTKAFPTNFPATWVALIGSTVTNASGSLTVLSGPPGPHATTIGTTSILGTDLTLTGGNGTPNGSFQVLTSTIANSLTNVNWTAITNGTFDGGGNFSVTVPYNPADGQRYYSIVSP